MTETSAPAPLFRAARPMARRLAGLGPWLVLLLTAVPAVWHAVSFPADIDQEFPTVVRPTFSRRPPPAYRLAEPGDTLDRVAMYLGAAAVVLAVSGLVRKVRLGQGPGLWPAAIGLSLAAFWYAATPGPTFDGWHGWGWRAAFDPAAPTSLRLALAASALILAVMVLGALASARTRPGELVALARERRGLTLLVAAALFVALRQVELPGVEPAGYWPRWALVWGLLAFDLALWRLMPPAALPTRVGRLGGTILGAATWAGLVALGLGLFWYHRPLERFRAIEPGRIFISAMPTYDGLTVAHNRHRFRTIINLFPEDTPLRSPRLPDELRFAREHGIQYVGSPNDIASSDAFLDQTLALARDPNAWPILVHCHGCMDRTPAWWGIYQFLVQGRPLDAILRDIEQHRGYRPKASVTMLYNRVLPPRAPGRYAADPTAQLLRRCAQGTVDPYYADLAEELRRANQGGPDRVSHRTLRSERMARP